MEGLAYIAQYPTVPAVWMGDFNMTMNPMLDHPVQPGVQATLPQQTRMCRTLTEFALVDIWRCQNPTARAYTCHSISYNTMFRIDVILVSKTLLPLSYRIGIYTQGLSKSFPMLDDSIFAGNTP